MFVSQNLPQCLMFCVLTTPCLGPSLQLHVLDVWPDKGHRNRIAQAYDNLENFPKNDENNRKKVNF